MARRERFAGNDDVRRGLTDFVRQLKGGSDAVKDFGAATSKAGKGFDPGRAAAGAAGAFGLGGIAQGVLSGGAVGGAVAGLQEVMGLVSRINAARAAGELGAPLFSSDARVRAAGRSAAASTTNQIVGEAEDKLGWLGRLNNPFGGFDPFGRRGGGIKDPREEARRSAEEARDRARAIEEERYSREEPVDRAGDRVGSFVGQVAGMGGRIPDSALIGISKWELARARREVAGEERGRRMVNALAGQDPDHQSRLGPR